MTNETSKIHFRPWIGADYENGIGGKRLLVLGESHYSDDDDPELTQAVMRELFDYKLGTGVHKLWMKTFTVFERSAAGRVLSGADSIAFWNSVMFCNFVQEISADASRRTLDVKNPNRSVDAFFGILEEYRPEYIIVWGYRLWDKLMPTGRWTWGEEIAVDGLPSIRFGYYTLPDGTRIKAVPVKHPSAGYSWTKWQELIDRFLK